MVADGLVTLYIEANASSYIELMHNSNSYEKSPYMTLNKLKRKAFIERRSELGISNDFIKKEQEQENVSSKLDSTEKDMINYHKPHLFKVHTFKGLNWCEFCGNFLWGFTAQGVKCEGN